MTHQQINKIIGTFVFLVALVLFLITVSPTVSFWDCGEFIATSFTMGVPHPPGSPIFLVLGRIFTTNPFIEDIGLRMNLMSVLASAFTILLLYLTIVRLIREWKNKPEEWTLFDKFTVYAPAVIGAFAFMVSDSFWFNAVEAEVYAMSMCLTALVTWLILKWSEQSEDIHNERWLLLIAYLFGIATAIHLLNLLAFFFIACIYYFKKYEFSIASFVVLIVVSILLFFVMYPGVVKYAPVIAAKGGTFITALVVAALIYFVYYTHVNRYRLANLAALSVLMLIMGYASYMVIHLRATVDPPINENDPSNTTRMFSYLNREQYGDSPIFPRRWSNEPAHQQEYAKYKSDGDFFWNYQIQHMFNRYLAWNFIGRASDVQDSGVDWSKFWGLPFLLGLLGLYHHFNRDPKRGVSILALFFVTGYAIVLYLNQTEPQPRERDYSYVGAFFAFAIWIGIGANAVLEYAKEYMKNEDSLKWAAPALTLVMLIFIPGRMLAVGFHEHDRSGNYVAYDYARNLLVGLEPNALIFTNGDNDTFPLWYQQEVERFRTDVRVVNLSLLNTDWYIKQLKNNQPRGAEKVVLPSNLTDEVINTVSPIQWDKNGRIVDIAVNKQNVLASDLKNTIKQEDIVDSLKWKINRTIVFGDYSLLRVQDFMIYNIIRGNEWKRPIYFAITVPESNRIGIDSYLRLEGLVYRLVPEKGGNAFDNIEPETMKSNIIDKYWYRNLNDVDVYYDENIRRLVINYRNLFMRLAYSYIESPDSSSSISIINKMDEFIPKEVFPYDDPRTLISLAEVYKYNSEYKQKYFELLGDAEELIKENMKRGFDPSDYMMMERVYTSTNRYADAAMLMDQLLVRYPQEQELKRKSERYHELAKKLQTNQNK